MTTQRLIQYDLGHERRARPSQDGCAAFGHRAQRRSVPIHGRLDGQERRLVYDVGQVGTSAGVLRREQPLAIRGGGAQIETSREEEIRARRYQESRETIERAVPWWRNLKAPGARQRPWVVQSSSGKCR